MQLGMIGLGRMGGNMVRWLIRAGHDCVAVASNADNVRALVEDDAKATSLLDDLIGSLDMPRAVWLMVPAGGTLRGCGYEWRHLGTRAKVIGGPEEAVLRLAPIFKSLAPDPGGVARTPGRTNGGLMAQAPVLSTAIFQRFTSRGEADFSSRLMSAMHYQFGGHLERQAGELAGTRS